jgi:hypothetical protein
MNGIVVAQNPTAGAVVSRGSRLELRIAQQPGSRTSGGATLPPPVRIDSTRTQARTRDTTSNATVPRQNQSNAPPTPPPANRAGNADVSQTAAQVVVLQARFQPSSDSAGLVEFSGRGLDQVTRVEFPEAEMKISSLEHVRTLLRVQIFSPSPVLGRTLRARLTTRAGDWVDVNVTFDRGASAK